MTPTAFFTLLNSKRFILDLIIASALFTHPMVKRSHFWLRLLAGGAVCTLLNLLLPNDNTQFIGAIPLTVALVWFCCSGSLRDAIYCVSCGYAVQHFYSGLYTVLCLMGLEVNDTAPPRLTLLLVCCEALVYVAAYLLFARQMGDGQGFLVDTKRSWLSIALILTAVLILSLLRAEAQVAGGERLVLICHLYDMLFCFVILRNEVNQIQRNQITRELALQQHLAQQQKEQYELTRETIDIINRKCHDMKHQVASLRFVTEEQAKEAYFNEIEDSIQIYDSTLQTGSEVLDTVLTEKSLYCEAHQIVLTCVANGGLLSFLDPVDLYTIFGNALDNAIESVSRLETPEKRIISVAVWEKNGMAMIQMENYYEGSPQMENGLPITTKPERESHGFGLKSIRLSAEKYGGHMTVHPEHHLFVLRLSFPLAAVK